MGITPEQFREMERRTKKNRKSPIDITPGLEAGLIADNAYHRELDLHNEIIKWCLSQWPRVPYIHANPVVKSTIQEGAQDFTLFYNDRAICIECKSRDGKLTQKQEIWKHEMAKQGFTVHVIRSMEEFLRLL